MSDKRKKGEIRPAVLESGIDVLPVYGPEELEASGGLDKVGRPGEYPFTRGIHPLMYRKRPFTMRQYSGFGTARETNERFKWLIANGQTGLNVAFDLPTQVGLDSDDPFLGGELTAGLHHVTSLAEAGFHGRATHVVAVNPHIAPRFHHDMEPTFGGAYDRRHFALPLH